MAAWIGSLLPLGVGKEEERQRVGVAVYQNFHQAVNRVFARFGQAKPDASGAGQYILTDADADSVALVNALEDCLFHGLKKSGDGAPHCWHFLEVLSKENKLAFEPTIVAIGMCRNLRTDRGLCRAWIRKALNQNCLHYCFETLFAKSTVKLRTKFYESHAFVRDEGAASAMCGVLKAFDSFPSDLEVDCAALDIVRPLDPEEALSYSKKAKQELEALEVEVHVTECGVHGAIGQYVVANPAVAKQPISRRLEKPAHGDGGGRELARYKHCAGNFFLVCCTPSVILTPSLSAEGALPETIILWNLMDDAKVLYFVEACVGSISGHVFPPWSLVPPQSGWLQALDDAGNPFASLPVPVISSVMHNGPAMTQMPLKPPEPPLPAARTPSPVPVDTNWTVAKPIEKHETAPHSPALVSEPPDVENHLRSLSPLAAVVMSDALPEPIALDSRSITSQRSRRSRRSSISHERAATSVLSGGSQQYAALAVAANGPPGLPLSTASANSSGSSAWSARRLDEIRNQVSGSSGIRKTATAPTKATAAIQSSTTPAPSLSPRKPGALRAKRRLNKSASTALDFQRLTMLDSDISPGVKALDSPAASLNGSLVLGDDSLANVSLSSMNSEDVMILARTVSVMSDAVNDSAASAATVIEAKQRSPQLAPVQPPTLPVPDEPVSHPLHGSPGLSSDAASPLDLSVDVSIIPATNQSQGSVERASPAGCSPLSRHETSPIRSESATQPGTPAKLPRSPLGPSPRSTAPTSPALAPVTVIRQKIPGGALIVAAQQVDDEEPTTVTRRTVLPVTTRPVTPPPLPAPIVPPVAPAPIVEEQMTDVNTSVVEAIAASESLLSDSLIEESKDAGPAPLDAVTSAFASERKRLLEKLERSQSRSKSRSKSRPREQPQPAVPVVAPYPKDDRAASRMKTQRSAAVDPSRSRSVGMQRIIDTSGALDRSMSRTRVPRAVSAAKTNTSMVSGRDGAVSRSKSRSRARVDVLEHVGPNWKLELDCTVQNSGSDDSSDDSLFGGSVDVSTPVTVQSADVFYAPIRGRHEPAVNLSLPAPRSTSGARRREAAGGSKLRRPTQPDSVRHSSPQRSIRSPQSHPSPDDTLVRVPVSMISRGRMPSLAEVTSDHSGATHAAAYRSPEGPVAILTNFLIPNYCSLQYPAHLRPPNGSTAPVIPQAQASPAPSVASAVTLNTTLSTASVVPRIVNQLETGEALLHRKLELCDIVARVKKFRVAKSKGTEYVEFAVEVYMLADAYARMCVHCNVPVDRNGDVYCFTRWFRFSKFAKFHAALQAALPNAKLPLFPAPSMFQFLDANFLYGRQCKLQAYMEGLMGMRRVRYKEAPVINGVAALDMSSNLQLASFLRCVPRDCLGKEAFLDEYYADLMSAFKLCYASANGGNKSTGPTTAASPADSVPSHFTSTSTGEGGPVTAPGLDLSYNQVSVASMNRSVSVLTRSQFSGQAPLRSESARRHMPMSQALNVTIGTVASTSSRSRVPLASRNVFSPHEDERPDFAWSPQSRVPYDTSSVGSRGSDIRAALNAVSVLDVTTKTDVNKSMASEYDDHVPMDSGSDSGAGSVALAGSLSAVLRRLVLSGIKYDRSLAEKCQRKEAMKRQNGLCAECQAPLSRGLLSAGYAACEYSGTLCCKSCHGGDMRIIPARVMWLWDLEPAPVCKRVAALLDLHFNEPIVCLSAINPSLFDTHSVLQKVRGLRTRLVRMRSYLTACPSAAKHMRSLGDKAYYLDTAEMWSFADISDIPSGALQATLLDFVSTFRTHIIKECEACFNRGLRCGICGSTKPLFEFELDTVAVCPEYRHYFHKACLARSGDCPSCIDGFFSASGREGSGNDSVSRYGRPLSRGRMRVGSTSSFGSSQLSSAAAPVAIPSTSRSRLGSRDRGPPIPQQTSRRKLSVSFNEEPASPPQAVSRSSQVSDVKTPSQRVQTFFTNGDTVKRHSKP